MDSFVRNLVTKITYYLHPILPYGVYESWDDLNPRLYHAVHIYWLKFYGMWYNNFSQKTIYFWLQIIYTIIVLWLVCFLPCIGEVVYLLRRRQNIGGIAEGLYLFLSEMYTYVKVSVFWLNKEKIMNLLKYLHNVEFRPTETEHKDILRKSIKTARGVMTNYSSMCVGAVSVGILIPIAESFSILPTNVEYPLLNVYNSTPYKTFYVHHVYYKPATCIIDGVMDTILAAFIASAIGQIEILAFNLRNIDLLVRRRRERIMQQGYHSEPQHNLNRIVIKECIKHHNSIIKYVSMIEDAFSLASALQFMLSVMVLCLIGVQFLSIEEPSKHPIQIMWMAIYLSCMLVEVFILCWFGNELISKSEALRQAAFDGPWINIDHKTCMILIIFLERCQRPLRVSAGKIFTLSLDTYTVLINWAYKAFTVMSKAKNK